MTLEHKIKNKFPIDVHESVLIVEYTETDIVLPCMCFYIYIYSFGRYFYPKLLTAKEYNN